MATQREYEAAAREQTAHERGRTISHYTAKVVKQLTSPRKRGIVTPSKRASR